MLSENDAAFLEAMNNIQIDVKDIEYRVYYEPIQRVCTMTTTDTSQDGEYVVVSREVYDSIEFCPNYFVDENDEIKRIPVDYTCNKLLKLTDTHGFTSLKNNNIFVVPEDYNGETDRWTLAWATK